jgi:hypothetical protein
MKNRDRSSRLHDTETGTRLAIVSYTGENLMLLAGVGLDPEFCPDLLKRFPSIIGQPQESRRSRSPSSCDSNDSMRILRAAAW